MSEMQAGPVSYEDVLAVRKALVRAGLCSMAEAQEQSIDTLLELYAALQATEQDGGTR
jgi:hypothetical protein